MPCTIATEFQVTGWEETTIEEVGAGGGKVTRATGAGSGELAGASGDGQFEAPGMDGSLTLRLAFA